MFSGERERLLSPRLTTADSKGLVLQNRQVAIIGAGPFGLSVSAHLSALGIDHVIAGRPMDTWRSHMPDGMLMKSEPYASTIASPDGKHDVATYCISRGLDYVERMGPLTRERFLDYADWYTEQLVPDIQEDTVAEVSPAGEGFRVTFAHGTPITVRQVVVATGVLPYRHLPAQLAGLPSDLVTHSADHNDLDEFKGRRVAVIGAGQSALETAALLNEGGAHVQVVARTPKLNWNVPNPEYLSKLGRIRRPPTQLCEGWRCAFWYTPRAFRLLPQGYRIAKAPTVLGPAGAWWLRDRIEGAVDVLTGHTVRGADAVTGGVRLILDGPRHSVLDAEHVIAGTGFRVDITRLPFLPETLRSAINTLNGYALVSRVGESSVPGLYFTGASTLLSIGPSSRFIAGTHSLSSMLAKSVAQHARGASK
jgi:thioredoxin reductase